jgi:acyl-CoA thioester hydrolase
MGIGQQQFREQTGGMFVDTETHVRHLRPARLDDELIVTAAVHEKGLASLTIMQQALLKQEQTTGQPPLVLCTGTIRIGWVDIARMRPTRIPSTLLEKFS